ncbi:MAG: hypothetical protein AAF805_10850 [Planctomycetota bacterium]
MANGPQTPPTRRRGVPFLLRVVLAASIGVSAFYGLRVGERVLFPPAEPPAELAVAPAIELPGAAEKSAASAADRTGNRYLRAALESLASRRSITCSVEHSGWIDGRRVAVSGAYQQHGAGPRRRFLLDLRGSLLNTPTRMVRVSDSRFLWTEVTWREAGQEPQRRLTRVDLRRVRRALGPDAAATPDADVDATAAWPRWGGLPSLVAGLDAAFDFGPGRLMMLRQERVIALVGRWTPEARARLAGDDRDALPARAPDHVVVALSEKSLSPLLVEYRSFDDPLSASGLADDARLRPSRQPLAKIDLRDFRFDTAIEDRRFAYQPTTEDWTDETDRELRLLRGADDRAVVALAGGGLRR